MTQAQTESPPVTWDQRLEKYGWYEALANHVADFGVNLSVGEDERGQEVMLMNIENVQMTEPDPSGKLAIFGLKIEAEEAEGTVKIEVPLRKIVGNFHEAIATLVLRNDALSGKTSLERGPKNAHSGFFFFQILDIDRTKSTVDFAFRSGFNREDVERRRQLHTSRRN